MSPRRRAEVGAEPVLLCGGWVRKMLFSVALARLYHNNPNPTTIPAQGRKRIQRQVWQNRERQKEEKKNEKVITTH
jgi:hypothetical protein